MADWPTVRLPREMMDRVEKFMETKHAKSMGFTNKSQIIVAAVRNFLQTEQEVRFYLNSKKFKKKIPFKRISTMIFCELCNSQVCEHSTQLHKHRNLFSFELIEEGAILAENPKFSD